MTAVLARVGSRWKARDVEVDDAQSLDDLADVLRAVGVDDQPVLAVVDHEDEWFALIRVDGEDEPKIFVSDLAAASHSRFGSLLSPAADVEVDVDPEGGGPLDDEDVEVVDDDGEPPEISSPVWAGEVDLLEDFGVSGRTLRRLVEDGGDDPGAVLGQVGDTVGFGEILEALR
jgi:putative tRNA adenosine deaminase-associated protein